MTRTAGKDALARVAPRSVSLALAHDAESDFDAALILADQLEGLGDLAGATALRDGDLTPARYLHTPPPWTERRPRIESLTDAERARMPEYVAHWLAVGLRGGPTTDAERARFARAIAICYDAHKDEPLPPPRVVWVTSPLVACLVGPIVAALRGGDGPQAGVDAGVEAGVAAGVSDGVAAGVAAGVEAGVADGVGNGVRAGVGNGVGDGVAAGVGNGVRAGVDAGVRAGVDAGVRAGVRDGVEDGVEAGVEAGVADGVRGGVGAGVAAGVRDGGEAGVRAGVAAGVRDGVRAGVDAGVAAGNTPLRNAIRDVWHRYIGTQPWVGWGWYSWSGPSVVSYLLDACGLTLGDRLDRIARANQTLAETSYLYWPCRDVVIVAPRPPVLERDDNGRLTRAAWSDGWEVTMQEDGSWAGNCDVGQLLRDVLPGWGG